MKTPKKITAFLVLACAVALQAGPAAAAVSGPELPGPNALTLVAAGVVAAVYIARRLR